MCWLRCLLCGIKKCRLYSIYHHLKISDLIVERVDEQHLKPFDQFEDLKFGKKFSDHMLLAEWKNETVINSVDSLENKLDSRVGWSAPVIKRYQALHIAPSALVLHYGIEIFEGMKAYKDNKSHVRLFRPMQNMDRLYDAALRLSLPVFDKLELLECIKELVRIDSRWIPPRRGFSLYIRPTMIGTQDVLGVSPSNRALFFTICCPVGTYYKTGAQAISLVTEETFVRAWPGGTGCYKMGGNYAPGVLPQFNAYFAGFQQILWLFGQDAAITEMGAMNVFVYWINEAGELELVTPPLDGTILPGITRDSILYLAHSWGDFLVSERKITMHDLVKAIEEKRLKEMFGSGTAAVISPIRYIQWRDRGLKVPLDPNLSDSQSGPLAKRFTDTLTDIQHGIMDFEGWSEIIG